MAKRFLSLILTFLVAFPHGAALAMESAPQAAVPAQQPQQEVGDCAICLQPLDQTQKALCQQHKFHARCVADAFLRKASCPLCRRAFSEDEQKKIRAELIQLDPEIRKKLEREKLCGCL